jgi:hypothetical protein
MGERAPGVERMTAERPDARTTSREMSQRLGAEIAIVREELNVLLAELDRRRHDLLDVRLQLRRHAKGTALTTLALVGVAAGAVWLSVGRRRRGRRLTADAGRLPGAISGVTEQPGRATAAATMAGKVVTAAASAAVASLVRKALEHAVRRLLEPKRDGGSTPEPLPTRRSRRLRDAVAADEHRRQPLHRLQSTVMRVTASEN